MIDLTDLRLAHEEYCTRVAVLLLRLLPWTEAVVEYEKKIAHIRTLNACYYLHLQKSYRDSYEYAWRTVRKGHTRQSMEHPLIEGGFERNLINMASDLAKFEMGSAYLMLQRFLQEDKGPPDLSPEEKSQLVGLIAPPT